MFGNDRSPVAIVTGGARGIGRGVANRLAADGCAVAVLDLTAEACATTVEEIAAAGGTALAVGADVSVEDDVTAAVDRVVAELGAPTVLVNNAGIVRDNLLFKLQPEEWDAVINVHLRGAYLMSRATQKYMVDAGWGRIVNLSSTSALGKKGQANYAAAKSGLQGFTKTLAMELGKFGVTANTVAPGFVVTEMTRDTAARIGMPYDEYAVMRAAEIPVGRVGQPADIAAAVSFFVSEEASFVSGQVLYVAGGPKA
ncbi:beta-ketoacyl-ACP reductase [Streptomyces dioscori]|uniref:Beta-ketoacyl-ACP reductase n=1 Tax=Streptomyces dioscori TaxID=2109333 RepID=A0A2P8PYD4_9ACTN|nr:3-oxoacyl-ACP reductase FabG [Streptomyces dioscori]PSM39003.1 beta-ketoacyl-ACP reductase [Streptomyces dioscori]